MIKLLLIMYTCMQRDKPEKLSWFGQPVVRYRLSYLQVCNVHVYGWVDHAYNPIVLLQSTLITGMLFKVAKHIPVVVMWCVMSLAHNPVCQVREEEEAEEVWSS